MAGRKIDPKEQFSKKLAGRVEWFWFGYMAALVAAIVIAPDAGMPAVYLGIMVTAVMLVMTIAYTKNSIDEKWFYWAAKIAEAVGGKGGGNGVGGDEEENG